MSIIGFLKNGIKGLRDAVSQVYHSIHKLIFRNHEETKPAAIKIPQASALNADLPPIVEPLVKEQSVQSVQGSPKSTIVDMPIAQAEGLEKSTQAEIIEEPKQIEIPTTLTPPAYTPEQMAAATFMFTLLDFATKRMTQQSYSDPSSLPVNIANTTLSEAPTTTSTSTSEPTPAQSAHPQEELSAIWGAIQPKLAEREQEQSREAFIEEQKRQIEAAKKAREEHEEAEAIRLVEEAINKEKQAQNPSPVVAPAPVPAPADQMAPSETSRALARFLDTLRTDNSFNRFGGEDGLEFLRGMTVVRLGGRPLGMGNPLPGRGPFGALNASLPAFAGVVDDDSDDEDERVNQHTAHDLSVHITVSIAARALKKYYAQANLDESRNAFIQWVHSLKQDDMFTKAAKRCINWLSDATYTDLRSEVTMKEAVGLVWLAINDKNAQDNTVYTEKDIEERRIGLITGLHQIIRGNNLDDTGKDNGASYDLKTCDSGSFNKLMSTIGGAHKKVNLLFVNEETIVRKVNAMVDPLFKNLSEADQRKYAKSWQPGDGIPESLRDAIMPEIVTQLTEELTKVTENIEAQLKEVFDPSSKKYTICMKGLESIKKVFGQSIQVGLENLEYLPPTTSVKKMHTVMAEENKKAKESKKPESSRVPSPRPILVRYGLEPAPPVVGDEELPPPLVDDAKVSNDMTPQKPR